MRASSSAQPTEEKKEDIRLGAVKVRRMKGKVWQGDGTVSLDTSKGEERLVKGNKKFNEGNLLVGNVYVGLFCVK